jgi:hypothetical protein
MGGMAELSLRHRLLPFTFSFIPAFVISLAVFIFCHLAGCVYHAILAVNCLLLISIHARIIVHHMRNMLPIYRHANLSIIKWKAHVNIHYEYIISVMSWWIHCSKDSVVHACSIIHNTNTHALHHAWWLEASAAWRMWRNSSAAHTDN